MHVANEDTTPSGERPPSVDEPLLHAARRTVGRFGLEDATMARIAEEASCSRVTLHRRGITKAVVLDALTERVLVDYRRAVWPALTGRGAARERLELALNALCRVTEENLELLLALGSHGRSGSGEPGPEDSLTRTAFAEPIERLLRDGAVDGSLRATDPEETAAVLANVVGESYLHLRVAHRWRPARARRATLDLALHGVVPR